MKIMRILPITLVLLVALISGCNKDQSIAELNSVAALESLNRNAHNNQGESSLATVYLGQAGEYAILSKSGISNVFQSSVTGEVGSSPITGAAILLTCTEVAGTIYSVDAAGPLPCVVTNASRLTTSVGDMQTAYTDAAGRVNPDFLNVGA